MMPDAPPVVDAKTENMVEDAAILITEAKNLSAAFLQLSKAAPLQLRAGCERMGKSIRSAIEREGWQ